MDNGSLFQTALLEERYTPRVYAYYFKQWQGFEMPAPHSHNSTEIMYLINGVCSVEVIQPSGAIESLSLKKGELIVVDANVKHRLIVAKDKPCRMLNVEFGFQLAWTAGTSIRELAAHEDCLTELLALNVQRMVLADPEEVYHVLKSLVLELDRKERSEAMVNLLFAQLLIRIARLWHETNEGGALQAEVYVRDAVRYLQQNYDRDIRVSNVAAAVNLHPGYLHRIFRANTGRTVNSYLTAVRMEKAKMLLLHTNIPVADISEYVGVTSRQYFHLLFKKYTGLTPNQYRGTICDHPAEGRHYGDEG